MSKKNINEEVLLDFFDYAEDIGDSITIFATGHRPTKLPGGYDKFISTGSKEIRGVMTEMIEPLLESGVSINFVNGAALGFDTVFGFFSVRLKEKYPEQVTVTTYVPTLDHGNNWSSQRDRDYFELLKKRSDNVYFSWNRNYKNKDDLQKRNEDMVKMSEFGIALFDGTAGGTNNCINYAKTVGTPIFAIHPKTLKIKKIN